MDGEVNNRTVRIAHNTDAGDRRRRNETDAGDRRRRDADETQTKRDRRRR